MLCCCAGWAAATAQRNDVPRLEKQQGQWQMTVEGKPFLMLAGELHNSATGSAHGMAPIWQRMAAKNLNTVIAAVSWELTEPEEGKFDFALVDEMIRGAREANLRLALLWFGSWKNGASTYVPGWVKRDKKRFPLAHFKGGEPTNTLSALSKNAMEADTRAFAALMRHIKEVDGDENTVIAIQIENEVGTLDAASSWGGWPNRAMRDYSPLADKAFASPVPQALMHYLKAHQKRLQPAVKTAWEARGCKMIGTWEEVFGKSDPEHPVEVKHDSVGEEERWKWQFPYLTEELFNTWNYATYVESLARAAKSIYPLPLFVNAWIKGDFREPGKYPSGGPQPHMVDVWRAAAPDIDLLCPDIYSTDLFDWVMERYDMEDNPVMVPETRCGSDGAARAFYAFGRYQTLCYSPFGIDGGGLMNSADPNDHAYDKAYRLLEQLSPYIIKYRRAKRIEGLLLDNNRTEDKVTMGKYVVAVRPYSTWQAQALVGVAGEEVKMTGTNVAGLVVMQEAEDQFLVAGGIGNLMVNVYSAEQGRRVAFESVDEVTFDAEGNELLHRLNGDETTLGGPVIRDGEVKAFRIKMYEY
jgi:hypothetical protein